MRRTDIDLLRVVLCFGVILAHALLIYAAEPRYHLKSAEPSMVASAMYEFLRPTLMTSWFVLAGWASLKSLRGRGPWRFLRERATRLLVPLTFGIIVFGSMIKYIELSHGRDIGLTGLHLVEPLQGGFFEFFPRNLKFIKQVTWSHLYFLAYLFLISLLVLPLLMVLLRRPPNLRVPPSWMVYLPALPMAALLAIFNGFWPYLPNLIHDWTNFAYFTLCVAIGAGIAAWPGFEVGMKNEAPRLALLMVAAFAGVMICGESTLGRVFIGILSWAAVGAALGGFARLAPPEHPAVTYINEAMLPVYIVHHAPLLAIGALLLPLALPVWLSVTLITLSSTVISLVAYHWLIRPFAPMRFLMGMPPAPPAVAPKAVPAAAG